jgi:hypothetical protein
VNFGVNTKQQRPLRTFQLPASIISTWRPCEYCDVETMLAPFRVQHQHHLVIKPEFTVIDLKKIRVIHYYESNIFTTKTDV